MQDKSVDGEEIEDKEELESEIEWSGDSGDSDSDE